MKATGRTVETGGESVATALRIDDRTRLLVRLLDESFGESWVVNDDPRYREELPASLCIDVVLPLALHPEAVEKSMEIEGRLRNEFRSEVAIFVIAPDES